MSVDLTLDYALRSYDLANADIESVNSGSNKVYKITKGERKYYLRISTRPFVHIAAEINWMTYLSSGVVVPELIKSADGRLIETYEVDGKTYIICVYREMEGAYWDKNNPLLWNETVFYNWGKTMGKTHQMTKEYKPSDNAYSRPRFEDYLVPLEYYKSITSVYEKIKRVQNEILALSRDSDSYGLIHCDMHQQNMLISGDHIGVLDFDDCKYGWFALDIGIALYHALWWGLPDDDREKNAFAAKIVKSFIKGYNKNNHLSDYWIKKIPLFMLYRQIDALSWHLNYYKPATTNELVYNDLFKIYYDFDAEIRLIEKDTVFQGQNVSGNEFAENLY